MAQQRPRRLSGDAVSLLKWLSANGGEGKGWVDLRPYRKQVGKGQSKPMEDLIRAGIAERNPNVPKAEGRIEARLVPGHNLIPYQVVSEKTKAKVQQAKDRFTGGIGLSVSDIEKLQQVLKDAAVESERIAKEKRKELAEQIHQLKVQLSTFSPDDARTPQLLQQLGDLHARYLEAEKEAGRAAFDKLKSDNAYILRDYAKRIKPD